MGHVNWVWKVPLILAALGYVSTFLLWGSHTSTQCIGFKGIALLVTLAVLAGVIAVIVIGLGDTGRKLIKCSMAALGGLLSLPLLLPVALALGGVHAGDTVCRTSTYNELSEVPSEKLPVVEINRSPATTIQVQPETPIPVQKLPCVKNAPAGYSLGSSNCNY